MQTQIPQDLLSPNVVVNVIRSGSNLHFTYGDGSSEDINVLTIGQSVLPAATALANARIATATAAFAKINPLVPADGAIKTLGHAGFVYNDTWIQITP